MLSTCNRTELYLAREENAEDEAVAAVTELAGDRAARSRRGALPAPGRGGGAAPLPRRRRARLARPRRGRDPRAGAKRVRGRLARPAARPPLPPGAAHRAPRPDRDGDRREPCVGAVGGRRARAAGVRRAPAAGACCCSAPARSARRPRATSSHAGRRSPSSRTGRSPTARIWRGSSERGRSRSTRSRPSSSTRTWSCRRRAQPASSSRRRRSPTRSARARAVRLLLVDLAVPRDLDPAINGLEGCFLYDVDDLRAVVEETLSGRRGEAARAERLVAEEAERFREWHAALDIVPTIASLRALAEEIRDSELARAGGRLSETRAPARRIGHLPDPGKAPASAHDSDERSSCGSRWSGLC